MAAALTSARPNPPTDGSTSRVFDEPADWEALFRNQDPEPWRVQLTPRQAEALFAALAHTAAEMTDEGFEGVREWLPPVAWPNLTDQAWFDQLLYTVHEVARRLKRGDAAPRTLAEEAVLVGMTSRAAGVQASLEALGLGPVSGIHDRDHDFAWVERQIRDVDCGLTMMEGDELAAATWREASTTADGVPPGHWFSDDS